jgi:hypothetical protein
VKKLGTLRQTKQGVGRGPTSRACFESQPLDAHRRSDGKAHRSLLPCFPRPVFFPFFSFGWDLGLGLESGEPAGWSQSAAREESCQLTAARARRWPPGRWPVAGGVACACGPFKSGRLYFSIKNQSTIVFVVMMS